MKRRTKNKLITEGMDEFTPIGPTGAFPDKEYYWKKFSQLKPKIMTRIYVNGLPFQIEKDELTAKEIIELVKAPIDNSELTTEDGRQVPLTANVILSNGQHYHVTRLRVGANASNVYLVFAI